MAGESILINISMDPDKGHALSSPDYLPWPLFYYGNDHRQKKSYFHCGEACTADKIRMGDKLFCCEGCKMVYRLLDGKGLCDYYQLNERPCINLGIPFISPVLASPPGQAVSCHQAILPESG